MYLRTGHTRLSTIATDDGKEQLFISEQEVRANLTCSHFLQVIEGYGALTEKEELSSPFGLTTIIWKLFIEGSNGYRW